MSATPNWIWQNGKMTPWQDATVHVMAHGLHYGSSVFEGIRAYGTEQGPAIFRLQEHLHRLFDSCKMYRMPVPYSFADMESACCDVIEQNELQGAYIRPIVYRDASSLGLAPSADDPMSVAVMAFEWGPLHGAEAVEKGSDVCVSSWKRIKSASNPVLSKAGGHYLTSQLISMEAKSNGFDEGIAVNEQGNLTEGAGANVFVVRKGVLLTPGIGSSILEGITRDTVFHLAKYLDLELRETEIPREMFYCADEMFMCGTAAEVTPIRSVDRIEVGDGKPGPITRALQKQFREVVMGQLSLGQDWLTYTNQRSCSAEHSSAATTNGHHSTTSAPEPAVE